MIAADTSTWIAFLEGSKGEDAQLLDKALEDRQVPSPLLRFKEFLEGPVKLFLRYPIVSPDATILIWCSDAVVASGRRHGGRYS